ncbi:MAG: helix-turn-helix domain-containing protein [Candidatus Absconditicoccaceae bacterium]
MDTNLIDQLSYYGFSDKEAKVYLTCLELGSSLASTVARRAEINRGTTYSILEDFKRRGVASENIRDELKYFSVLSPNILFKREEEKYEKMKSTLPELLAITEKFGNRPKTQFFEGLEGLKKIFDEVLSAGDKMASPYLSFVGTNEMDPRVEKYIYNEFIPQRAKIKTKTKAIMSRDKSQYMDYHKKSHNTLIVDKPLFDLGNEIVVYGSNKVAILMYDTAEMSGLTIESQTLHDGLTSLFNLIRDIYKKKK